MKKLVDKLRRKERKPENILQENRRGTTIAGDTLKDKSIKSSYQIKQTNPQKSKSSKFDSLNRFLIPKKTAISMLIPVWSAMMPHYVSTSSTAEDSEINKNENQVEQVTSYQENFIVDQLLKPNEDKEIELTMPAWTQMGKFQRTYRWDQKLDKVEDKHEIPTGTLKGMIMQESGGRVTAVSPDGGVGLGQFQPGTARAYDLDIIGDSYRTGKDSTHGKKLSNLVEEYNHDYKKLAKIDERFDPVKSIEAAGKYLSTLKRRHGTWDEAIERYNQGSSANGDPNDPYVTKIDERKKFYNKHDPTKPSTNRFASKK